MTEVAVTVGRDRPTGGAGSAAVEVAGLLKRYDGRAAVDGLDLRVARGEIVALLGRNGAGKTTTVEIIEGYREPDAGTVRVLGLDPRRDGAVIRPRLGVMLQRGELYGQIRVREAVELFAAFYDDPLDPGALLDQLSLGALADRRYRALSGGERARLDLALALIGRPDVAILDEPTAALGVKEAGVVLRYIAQARARGLGVVFITHNVHHAYPVGDRFTLLNRGRSYGTFAKSEISREEVVRMMAGGEELEELGHELEEFARLDAKAAATPVAASADAKLLEMGREFEAESREVMG